MSLDIVSIDEACDYDFTKKYYMVELRHTIDLYRDLRKYLGEHKIIWYGRFIEFKTPEERTAFLLKWI